MDRSRDSLYVNLFIASTLNWKEKGITLRQITSFPEAGKTRLEIKAGSPQSFTLNIRHPGWAANGLGQHQRQGRRIVAQARFLHRTEAPLEKR